MAQKYAIIETDDAYKDLSSIAESKHCLQKGSELATEKAAMLLIDDFRNGALGRITLEFPEDYK